MTDETTTSPRWPRADLALALAALAVSVVASLALELLSPTATPTVTVFGFVVFWVPLLAAAILVKARGWGKPALIAWRITWLDLLWGLGAGLLLRVIVTLSDMAIGGTTGFPTYVLATPLSPLAFGMLLLTLVVAPVIIAPLIEELYFRGTLLGALRWDPNNRVATIAAVVASSVLFALPHAIGAASTNDQAAGVVAALILGLGTGALAVATRRIGASVMAHVAFNGALVLAMLL